MLCVTLTNAENGWEIEFGRAGRTKTTGGRRGEDLFCAVTVSPQII